MLVVGAGPSGLSAAYHLARLGHWVTIKDAGAAAAARCATAYHCKGCGLCVAECPPGAIEMEPEPS